MEPEVGMYIRWNLGREKGVIFQLMSYYEAGLDSHFIANVVFVPEGCDYQTVGVPTKVYIYGRSDGHHYTILDGFDWMVKELRKEAGCE